MEILHQLLAIAIVFLLLGLLVWRFGQGRGLPTWPEPASKTLASQQRLRLTPQHSLHVVAASGRRWLLASHPAGVTLLAELGEMQPAAEAGGMDRRVQP